MLTRKNEDKQGQPFSDEWLQDLKNLLIETYADKLSSDSMTFEVFGESFKDEVVLVTTLLDSDDLAKIPVTLVISEDIESDKQRPDLLKRLIDITGLIFDDIFQSLGGNDTESFYTNRWQDLEFKDRVSHIKITRENLSLTLQANRLLQEH